MAHAHVADAVCDDEAEHIVASVVKLKSRVLDGKTVDAVGFVSSRETAA